jgi:protein-arginine kinase activator protein McsA
MPSFCSVSSPDGDQPCQACGSRPARNFICQIVNGQQTNLVLCDSCLRSQGVVAGFPNLDGTQACFHCGEVAAGASVNDAREFAVRQQRFHYSCARCAELEYTFTMEALSPLLDQVPSEQQEQVMRDMIRRVAQRVRRAIQDDTR